MKLLLILTIKERKIVCKAELSPPADSSGKTMNVLEENIELSVGVIKCGSSVNQVFKIISTKANLLPKFVSISNDCTQEISVTVFR
jgi:hypothetical protein